MRTCADRKDRERNGNAMQSQQNVSQAVNTGGYSLLRGLFLGDVGAFVAGAAQRSLCALGRRELRSILWNDESTCSLMRARMQFRPLSCS